MSQWRDPSWMPDGLGRCQRRWDSDSSLDCLVSGSSFAVAVVEVDSSLKLELGLLVPRIGSDSMVAVFVVLRKSVAVAVELCKSAVSTMDVLELELVER